MNKSFFQLFSFFFLFFLITSRKILVLLLPFEDGGGEGMIEADSLGKVGELVDVLSLLLFSLMNNVGMKPASSSCFA